MSEIHASVPATWPAQGSRAEAKTRPQSWVARALLRVVGGWGARLGLCWVLLLVFCAVFSPLLANGYPLLWNGGSVRNPGVDPSGWCSPAYEYATPSDVLLLIACFAVLGCLFLVRRVPLGERLAMAFWVLLCLIPAVVWKVAWAGLHEHPWSHLFAQTSSAVNPAGLPAASRSAARLFWFGALLGIPLWAAATGGLWWLMKWRGRPLWVMLAVVAVISAVFVWKPVQPQAIAKYAHCRQVVAQHPEITAIFAPIRYSPQDIRSKCQEEGEEKVMKPSLQHPMGTEDKGGYDVASRMIHGCRIALAVGLISTGIAVVLGVLIGGAMGYFAGWVDMIGMRIVDIVSSVPVFTILILVSVTWGKNIYLFMAIMGLFGWVGYAIYTRAEFLRLRNADYIQAAKAIGTPTIWILVRHLVPNGITPVLTLASFGVAGAVTIESGLSFMGLGLPPEDPSWGQLLEGVKDAVQAGTSSSSQPFQWWLVVFPSAAIFLTVFSYNLVGEALRDALDPKSN